MNFAEPVGAGDWIFFSLCVGTLASVVGMGMVRDTLRAVLFFLCQSLSLFAWLLWLRADYLAAVQLVIYVGGGVVLMAYCAMNLQKRHRKKKRTRRRKGLSFVLLAGVYFGLQRLLASLQTAPPSPTLPQKAGQSIPMLSQTLITTHAYAWEWTGFLLLIALVGATILVTRGLKR